ncbi:probable 2-oxoglutarate-dependent dioxygenase AOP1 [Juglans microcarpa x Juglans regia]|uniref:probable 2-oxoglutarate-dependent dioxygenase AOP1 n=1 Tax=Juglans microcarpa x Juglans regia TaxID=2249226 RepID=UPI001B7E4982|nr:probable 2-oxoglutarate-dependent dioxygenase AOP1 [Juglans microcarpa x Juglans regia]
MGSELQPKLPVLDFSCSENLKPGTSSWLSACKKVRGALEDYGCFVLVYDKVSSELLKQVFGALEELFDLPTEIKMKNKYENRLNGYVGQIQKLPLHESMGIQNATTLEATQSFSNLLWPDGNDHFSACMHSYAKLTAELDQMVTRMIYESYGVGKYHASAYTGSTTYLLRVLKNRVPEVNEPNLGFVTHTDKSFTTILHQNQVNGLEVETKDGEWISVEYPPSSFVVMAGDALMAWSNDRIQSPKHRVVMMNENEARYSLALFSFSDGIIEVPKELVDDEHPLQYKPFNHRGLVDFFSKNTTHKDKFPIKSYCGV